MHYVYILKRDNGRWYIGYTHNLQRRMLEHKKDWKFNIVYFEAYVKEKTARDRERKLKYYGSAWRGLIKRINA